MNVAQFTRQHFLFLLLLFCQHPCLRTVVDIAPRRGSTVQQKRCPCAVQAREYAIYNRDAEVAVHLQRYAVWGFGTANDENVIIYVLMQRHNSQSTCHPVSLPVR